MCVLSHISCVQLSATLWIRACQAPLSLGILHARILVWVATPSSRGCSWPRDGTSVSSVSCISRQALYHQCHLLGEQILNVLTTYNHTHKL